MEILSIIPARGGSKGIKLKNLAKIHGKPLLYYSIKASKKSKLVTKTVVSTDNAQIMKYAKKMNVDVLKRSSKLSSDKSKLEPVIQDVLKQLKKNNYIPDIILLLQNTSPLRTSKHIDESIKLLKKNNYDSVLSGFVSHFFLWKNKNNFVKPINYDPMNRPNRQDIKDEFVENGAIYITKKSSFEKSRCRISGKIGLYQMSEDDSIDINEHIDLLLANQLMRRKK